MNTKPTLTSADPPGWYECEYQWHCSAGIRIRWWDGERFRYGPTDAFSDGTHLTNFRGPLVVADELAERLAVIRAKLAEIVCTEGCDAGVVMLSQDGPTHPETHGGRTVQVYDHEYFSPLGDALMELWKLTEVK